MNFMCIGHDVCFGMQELRKDGFDLAESRYRELKPILDEVNIFILFIFLSSFPFEYEGYKLIHFPENQTLDCFHDSNIYPCTLQLAILEVEQKAEEEEAETSSRKRGKKKNKH